MKKMIEYLNNQLYSYPSALIYHASIKIMCEMHVC